MKRSPLVRDWRQVTDLPRALRSTEPENKMQHDRFRWLACRESREIIARETLQRTEQALCIQWSLYRFNFPKAE